MTANALWPSRPNEKWQHRLSSRIPTGTEPASKSAHQSAHRNTVESNMRRNKTTKTNASIEWKNKRTSLDTSDLLIESAFIGTNLEKTPILDQ
jgi:hypothetical protein